MRKKMSSAFLLILTGFICLTIGGVLGYQYYHRIHFHQFPMPKETDIHHIEGWMTIPFVARLYHVPEQELFDALHILPIEKKTNITSLAKKGNKNVDIFLSEVQSSVATIQEYQKTHPPIPSP